MREIIEYSQLEDADLVIDAIYEGGNFGNASDDPISKIMGCGNQGGFRYVGSLKEEIKLCVLYSSFINPDWPDNIDFTTGILEYYGDNRSSGKQIHDTQKKGNLILQDIFNNLHSSNRERIPPFFIFSKGSKGRNVIFRGLAVPGAQSLNPTEDLIAIWKAIDRERFQNYKSIFTILKIPIIKRAWITDLLDGKRYTKNTPLNWLDWVEKGKYDPLIAPRSVDIEKRKNRFRPIEKAYK